MEIYVDNFHLHFLWDIKVIWVDIIVLLNINHCCEIFIWRNLFCIINFLQKCVFCISWVQSQSSFSKSSILLSPESSFFSDIFTLISLQSLKFFTNLILHIICLINIERKKEGSRRWRKEGKETTKKKKRYMEICFAGVLRWSTIAPIWYLHIEFMLVSCWFCFLELL